MAGASSRPRHRGRQRLCSTPKGCGPLGATPELDGEPVTEEEADMDDDPHRGHRMVKYLHKCVNRLEQAQRQQDKKLGGILRQLQTAQAQASEKVLETRGWPETCHGRAIREQAIRTFA